MPSKSLIAAANAAAPATRTSISGVTPGSLKIDFPEIMRWLREVRAHIAEHDSAKRFAELGIDVFLGQGMFASPKTIEVGGDTLRFSRAVIATGGRPTVPNIEGLEETGFLTNLTVFDLTQLPKRVVFVGAGPIGCELAQAFARLGAEVTILECTRVLPRDDEDAASLVEQALIRDGLSVLCGAAVKRVESTPTGKEILVERRGEKTSIAFNEIFIAAGRTTNRSVFAAGDICLKYKFTHAADAAAHLVIRNALFFGRAKGSSLVVPWMIYELEHGFDRVPLIGTDCPELDESIIDKAFEVLADTDAVLGPAADGGYYLIALRSPDPELFANKNWGSSDVFEATVNSAEKLGLSAEALPMLWDVDRPEDLVNYELYKTREALLT